MKRFWCYFFMFWPILAVYLCWVAPERGWWFPTTVEASGASSSPIGRRIDDLFYMILWITTVTFIGTQVALGYVLFRSANETDDGSPVEKAWFSHGSHNLEVIWSIVPSGILLYVALYQMDVLKEIRVKTSFPASVQESGAYAELTARQFEWRIRYAGLDENGNLLPLLPEPQPTDLYTVNDLHMPSARPVMVNLKSGDVQHALFLPELRVKQDAVPGLVIPVWFEADKSTEYTMLCAELCGWGHYKMKSRLVTHDYEEWLEYLKDLRKRQDYDGVPAVPVVAEK